MSNLVARNMGSHASGGAINVCVFRREKAQLTTNGPVVRFSHHQSDEKRTEYAKRVTS